MTPIHMYRLGVTAAIPANVYLPKGFALLVRTKQCSERARVIVHAEKTTRTHPGSEIDITNEHKKWMK